MKNAKTMSPNLSLKGFAIVSPKDVMKEIHLSSKAYKGLSEDLLEITENHLTTIQDLFMCQEILNTLKEYEDKENAKLERGRAWARKCLRSVQELSEISGINKIEFRKTSNSSKLEIWAISDTYQNDIFDKVYDVEDKYVDDFLGRIEIFYAGANQIKDYNSFFNKTIG
jgi:hypothetical protein